MDAYNKHEMKRSYRSLEYLFDYNIVEETIVLITIFLFVVYVFTNMAAVRCKIYELYEEKSSKSLDPKMRQYI